MATPVRCDHQELATEIVELVSPDRSVECHAVQKHDGLGSFGTPFPEKHTTTVVGRDGAGSGAGNVGQGLFRQF